jgi:hypothetical protein
VFVAAGADRVSSSDSSVSHTISRHILGLHTKILRPEQQQRRMCEHSAAVFMLTEIAAARHAELRLSLLLGYVLSHR